MADSFLSLKSNNINIKQQHQMQKKNDTTESNDKWVKVWRMTSQTSFQASSITWNIWSGYKLETGSKNTPKVGWKWEESGNFTTDWNWSFDEIELISHLLKIDLSLDGLSKENARREYWWRGRKHTWRSLWWTDIEVCYFGITANPSTPKEQCSLWEQIDSSKFRQWWIKVM